MVIQEIDYVSLALDGTREKFVGEFTQLFLAGEGELVAPETAGATLLEDPTTTHLKLRGLSSRTPRPRVTVRSICKRQDLFPGMITIGRTPNNDVVLNDSAISKFHAFFRAIPTGLELRDAGS